MLVLTRKKNEVILIGDSIKITVIKGGEKVRLGIEAPKDMNIRRPEAKKK